MHAHFHVLLQCIFYKCITRTVYVYMHDTLINILWTSCLIKKQILHLGWPEAEHISAYLNLCVNYCFVCVCRWLRCVSMWRSRCLSIMSSTVRAWRPASLSYRRCWREAVSWVWSYREPVKLWPPSIKASSTAQSSRYTTNCNLTWDGVHLYDCVLLVVYTDITTEEEFNLI